MHYGSGKHDFWEHEVRRVVQDWRKENRYTLGSCLAHLESEPATVQDCCQHILWRWEPECVATQKRLAQKKYGTSDYYLQKALSHPHLRLLAIQSAQAMYAREQAEPGFLPYNLREVVVGIVEEGVFPAWKSQHEESMENL